MRFLFLVTFLLSSCSLSSIPESTLVLDNGHKIVTVVSQHNRHEPVTLRVPASYFVRGLENNYGVGLDIPYRDVAKDGIEIRPEWNTPIAITIVGDARAGSARHVLTNDLRTGHFSQDHHRIIYDLDQYWHADTDGFAYDNAFFPVNTYSEIERIDCAGFVNGPDPAGCIMHAQMAPGLTVDVTMPYGYMPQHETYWQRIKTLINGFVIHKQ